ncbi:glucosaminidase domain-containing protein [Myroides sp. M-43]|uniref:glucosaminidase domain-containing protein n=1 Tax=Myroides oncorhynchi TaxID=2893756 RepID=UPI001E59F51F|nr:glucosaminidase domain-containing protein [Myroides oncorhynchi]MCC9041748.1 glucosaminidase domain-containing protein [Myroides oncorhynchi]
MFVVGCASKKAPAPKSKPLTTNRYPTPTGKKVKEKELVSKSEYRSQLHKSETEKKKVEKKKSESEVLEATSRLSVTSDMIRDYILKYKETAKENMANHGIPASIKLAQGVLESGSGQGTLSRNANNHFGIKCHQGWEGESVRHTDDAPDECFRKYSNPEESYVDHSLFLTNRGRYSNLFLLEKDDYEGWAVGLKSAGYATDPKYADKLISLIERYELYKYDAEVLNKKVSGPRPRTISTAKDSTNVANTTKNTSKTDKNNTKSKGGTHIVEKGDTLYNISKRYNLTVEQLQKMNSLTNNTISIGQTLKIK